MFYRIRIYWLTLHTKQTTKTSRARGRKGNTKPALQHQPHGDTYKLKEIQVDENDDQIKTPSSPPSKRGRKQLSTKQLQVQQSIDKRETRSSKKLLIFLLIP